VPARQLQFFESPKPLLAIFDQKFFQSVPRAPGVYIMTGKWDRVLYVGQSGNLRQRLATYKNCNPNNLSRRIIRLIHAVEKISWERCSSASEAQSREKALLRLHRPKFNVANVYPTYAYIGMKVDECELTLWVTRNPKGEGDLYGPFKGLAYSSFGALARCLWTALRRPAALDEFPCGVLGNRTHRISLSGPEPPKGGTPSVSALADVGALTIDYLGGRSAELVDWVQQRIPIHDDIPRFQKQLHEADVALLSHFFETGRDGMLDASEEESAAGNVSTHT
jgi:predicted GIY-YIG superfamily endonuclease